MAVANVDTFEHDIAEEIKHKEASFTDIASAGNDVGNIPPHATYLRLLIVIGIFFVIIILVAIGGLVYYYNQTPQVVPVEQGSERNTSQAQKALQALSPTLAQAIGDSVGSLSKNGYGYSVELTKYSEVFAYMLKNESAFADELAQAVGSPRDTSTTTSPFVWNDVTLSNQNMRVGVSGSSTLVYAFVNDTLLLISSSTQGILSMKGIISP